MQFVKIFYLKLNVLFHGKSGLESFQERPTQTYLSVRVVLAREEGVVTSDWGCQEELRSILRCEVKDIRQTEPSFQFSLYSRQAKQSVRIKMKQFLG